MKNPRDVVIIDGIRTPFAKAGTKLKNVLAADLGKTALKELVARTNLDQSLVDEVIVGNVENPSDKINMGRVVALGAGFPVSTSAFTCHRNCASSLESIAIGYDRIKAGSADVIVSGGTESMTHIPLLFHDEFRDIFAQLFAAKTMGQKLKILGKIKLKHLKPRVSLMEGLTDPFVGINMGKTAEILAKEFKISRKEQDEFAVRSHLLASKAIAEGRMGEEITPVYEPPDFKNVIEQDFGPRANQTVEALQKLRPFFDKKTGTVTPGNSCPITDGAGMVLLMTREKAEALGYKPLVSIKGYAFAALEPERMGLGPVYSTAKLLKRLNMKLSDIELFELNEAFAVQALSCLRAMESEQFCKEKFGLTQAMGEIPMDRLNVNGGAIALGHPVGATGVRIVLTLMKEMKRRGVQTGLATLCIGGGQGGAIILESEA